MVKPMVIAIVGMPGAGKSLVSAVAQSYQFDVLVCGDVIREETERRGLEPTRKNMAEVMLAIRREEGPAVVAERLIPKIESSASPVVVVEGVRSMAEVGALRKRQSVAVLGVHASPRTRYERLRARGRTDDPKSWEQFSERDLRELEVGIGDVIALADEMLINENEEKALEAASEAVLKKMTRE